MGTNRSKISQKSCKDVNMLKHRALLIYIDGLKKYNETIHGPLEAYMIQVEADYQLNCIPEHYRSK
jgi:hypothetical protein